jgi:serine O-acetyltransferase
MNPKRSGAIFLYYWANWLYRRHIPLLPMALQGLLFLVFGAVVPYRTDIGPGCRLAHGGNGVVIHEKARIGRNVIILSQVTIGGAGRSNRFPEIGDDVYIGTGAKILGPVVVGSNSVIGANAVVVKSVPGRCVAAGVPARIIRENVDSHSVENW